MNEPPRESMKDYGKANDALSDLLVIVGENPNTLHASAVCHQRLGNVDTAIDFAQRGIATDPTHLGCLEVLTEIHAARGDLDTAAEFARRALARNSALSDRAPAPMSAVTRLLARLRATRSGTSGRGSSAEWIRWANGLVENRRDAGNS